MQNDNANDLLLTVRKVVYPNDSPEVNPEDGLTLRDYFAMKALGGLLADSATTGSADDLADTCYTCADAMLKRRLR